jgi:threonine dehydrogenase-like Zn-dependent dehydrogenase
MGHEIAGIRADTRESVAVNPLIACHRCDLCRRGLENVCRSHALVGIHRAGGFAERVAVPESCLHPIGGLPFHVAALVEPTATGVHAFALAQQSDPQPQRVGVIGAGMIGLGSALVARRAGVPDVCICDLNEERLAAAARVAGVETSEELEGEFDVVVDAVGSEATRRTSVARLRPAGTAVWIGLQGPGAGFDARALVRSEQRVLGSYAYLDREFRAALTLLKDVRVDFTAHIALRDGVEAFRALLAGPDDATKTLLVP